MGNKNARGNRKRNQSANSVPDQEQSAYKEDRNRRIAGRNSTQPIREAIEQSPDSKRAKRLQKSSSSGFVRENKKEERPERAFYRDSMNTIKELDTKIVETKEKLKDVDEEIKNLEASPKSSCNQKLLYISKMKRENLNKFADNLILKQYFLDKQLFEASIQTETRMADQNSGNLTRAKEDGPSFKEIMREGRKSDCIRRQVDQITESLVTDKVNPFIKEKEPEKIENFDGEKESEKIENFDGEKEPEKIEIFDLEKEPEKIEIFDLEKECEKIEIFDLEKEPEKFELFGLEKEPEILELLDLEKESEKIELFDLEKESEIIELLDLEKEPEKIDLVNKEKESKKKGKFKEENFLSKPLNPFVRVSKTPKSESIKSRHFPSFPQKTNSIPWYLEGTEYDKKSS